MATARVLIAAASLATTACFGFGDYEVDTCATPVGTTTVVQPTGSLGVLDDLTFACLNGVHPIGAFALPGSSSVEAVGIDGYRVSDSTFFSGQQWLPRQPSVVPVAGGYAAVAIATTSPCTAGQLSFEYASNASPGDAQGPCLMDGSGAALPSLVPLPDGVSALVGWYETPIASRADPLESCAAAAAAPLVVSVIGGSATAKPSIGHPIKLTATSTSVRPAAMAPWPGHQQVLVAAPDGASVSIWSVDASLAPGAPESLPGLDGARAVSIAVATDGSGRIAVAAEIGCTPQSIRLAVGTLNGGWNTSVVAPAGDTAALQPSVSWVPAQQAWIVSWITASDGPRALARRFQPNGAPASDVIDPGAAATGASVSSDGELLAFLPGLAQGSFASVSLGCVQ